jgi:hypothetical protein
LDFRYPPFRFEDFLSKHDSYKVFEVDLPLGLDGRLFLTPDGAPFPTTADDDEVLAGSPRWDVLRSRESTLAVAANADWSLESSLLATGDTAAGRGARGPVPLHLIYESRDLRLTPNQNVHWRLTMKVVPASQLDRIQIARP